MAQGYLLSTDNGLIQNGNNLLNVITGVNLKNTGQTTLYTVPAGKTLMITDIAIIPTTVSVFATPAIVRIGKASGYSEWAGLVTLTGLNAAGQFISLNVSTLAAIRGTFAAGEVVKLDVQTGAGATTFTIDLHVWGYLY